MVESVGLPARGGRYGVFMSAFLSWRGEDAGQGHLVYSQLVAHSGPGGQISHTHKRMAKIHIFPLPAKSFSSILYFGREF